MASDFKIFSDPVHGFVTVPEGLIAKLVATPEVQRLRRIRQLGVGYLVFPGAEHSRFGHALGSMALMRDALGQIRDSGTPVSETEVEAALAGALLHDVGHGPFSHTLEHDLISGFRHEAMSRVLMAVLDERFDGRLAETQRFFNDESDRPFFHQLISSQLDMDRLDYLRRDAFYTGVSEGVVGVNRIIKTLRVHPVDGGPDARVVVASKGAYAVEAFIIARRLMYWQVYLHPAVIAGDHILRSAFKRARHIGDRAADCSPQLMFFLRNRIGGADISSPEVLENYLRLDDSDVLHSLKQWSRGPDPILADLSRRFLDRDFIRVRFLNHKPEPSQLEQLGVATLDWMQARKLTSGTDEWAAEYYSGYDQSSHEAYMREVSPIGILGRSGRLVDLSEIADTAAIAAVSEPVTKPYIYGPKEVIDRSKYANVPR